MQAIVPLAGPDFIGPNGELKAMQDWGGRPFLLHTLESRRWAHQLQPGDYTFVLVDRPETRAFAADALSKWFPASKKVFLSDYTRGAALSASAAISSHRRANEPIVLDLADILYASDLDPEAAFSEDRKLGGLALTFQSENPIYSYLQTDAAGAFVRAAEKQVISSNASAGTYFFSSSSVYLRALAHALDHEQEQTHRDLFFVCPLFNGVKAASLDVRIHPVFDVRDAKVTSNSLPG